MTDDASYYHPIGAHYRRHFVINHSIGEYVSGGTTTNAVENYFSILKRDINGVYQHVSATHLKRCVGEFDFRYNNRIALGVDDLAPHSEGRQRRSGQEAHLPKNSSAARSRSVLAARLGAPAILPLRAIRVSSLCRSMNRRSLNDLLERALKTLPGVRMQFDSFLLRCDRSWFVVRH
jgi:hypothetical protein